MDLDGSAHGKSKPGLSTVTRADVLVVNFLHPKGIWKQQLLEL